MTDVHAPEQHPEKFVGYGPAAEYLGIKRNTLSSYCTKGIGPVKSGEQRVGPLMLPIFTRAELDTWRESRPGQGARTDLPLT